MELEVLDDGVDRLAQAQARLPPGLFGSNGVKSRQPEVLVDPGVLGLDPRQRHGRTKGGKAARQRNIDADNQGVALRGLEDCIIGGVVCDRKPKTNATATAKQNKTKAKPSQISKTQASRRKEAMDEFARMVNHE